MEFESKLLIDLKDFAKSTLFELNRNVIREELGLLLESLPHREPLSFREELAIFEQILRACPELSDPFKDLILLTISKFFDSIQKVFMLLIISLIMCPSIHLSIAHSKLSKNCFHTMMQ